MATIMYILSELLNTSGLEDMMKKHGERNT